MLLTPSDGLGLFRAVGGPDRGRLRLAAMAVPATRRSVDDAKPADTGRCINGTKEGLTTVSSSLEERMAEVGTMENVCWRTRPWRRRLRRVTIILISLLLSLMAPSLSSRLAQSSRGREARVGLFSATCSRGWEVLLPRNTFLLSVLRSTLAVAATSCIWDLSLERVRGRGGGDGVAAP